MMIAGSEGLLVDMHYGQKQAYSTSNSAEIFAKLSQAQAPALLVLKSLLDQADTTRS